MATTTFLVRFVLHYTQNHIHMSSWSSTTTSVLLEMKSPFYYEKLAPANDVARFPSFGGEKCQSWKPSTFLIACCPSWRWSQTRTVRLSSTKWNETAKSKYLRTGFFGAGDVDVSRIFVLIDSVFSLTAMFLVLHNTLPSDWLCVTCFRDDLHTVSTDHAQFFSTHFFGLLR